MNRRRLPVLVSAVLGGGSAPSDTIYFREEFTTPEAAPLTTPRTAVPGPGTLVFVFSGVTATAPEITGGAYKRYRPTAGQSYTGLGCYTSTSFTRTPGLMFYAKQTTTVMSSLVALGVHTSAALVQFPADGSILWSNTSALTLSTYGLTVGTSLSNSTAYQNAIITRSVGAHYLMQGGSQYAAWTRLYVSAVGSSATLYATFPNFDSATTLDTVDVRLKASNSKWLTDYGGAIYYDATPTANDTFTGVADSLIYITWTVTAAETLSIYFRRTDDSNCYRLDCAQAGGTIKLYRVDAGVDTELNAGKTQTWTAASQYRIGIVTAAGTIMTFVETSIAITAKHVVTGETSYLTNPGGKVAGFATGSNLEVWKRTLAGTDETDVSD